MQTAQSDERPRLLGKRSRLLGPGLVAKQMQASAGQSFPRHRASAESVLVVTEGRCIIRFTATDQTVGAGQTAVITANEWHHVEASPSFTAVHVIPKEIRFAFSGPRT